jgi:hypothetical protein
MGRTMEKGDALTISALATGCYFVSLGRVNLDTFIETYSFGLKSVSTGAGW